MKDDFLISVKLFTSLIKERLVCGTNHWEFIKIKLLHKTRKKKFKYVFILILKLEKKKKQEYGEYSLIFVFTHLKVKFYNLAN